MLSLESLLGMIGRIYDAAADESLWPAFLEGFASAIDGTATALIFHDMTVTRAKLMISARCDPECQRQYLAYYTAFDPYRSASPARSAGIGPECIYIGAQIIDSNVLRRTEFFNDFSLAHGLVHHFCAPLTHDTRWWSNLACHRPAGKDPFGTDELELLRILFPHLQRAMQFHRRFAELEGRHRASLDALDRLPVGVILLDERGKIIATNCEAERVLRENDGLSGNTHGIRTAWQGETKVLQGMIAGAAKTAGGEGTAAGGLLALSRPSGKQPLTILVAPVGRNAFAADLKTPCVVLFVTDPERKPASLPGALAQLYNLTAAESHLAQLLMRGETVVRAAERLGVSHNTARTHLQRIYQKTGTTHQGGLVRVLLSGTSALLTKPEHPSR